jgi:hypothetical protein
MPNARVRATVQLRAAANPASALVESLGAGKPVDILEDQGDWLKVQVSNTEHEIPGWTQREALAFPPSDDFFPRVKTESGASFSTVPHSLKAGALREWSASPQGELNWIPKNIWGEVTAPERDQFKNKVRSVLDSHQLEWDAWLAGVEAQGRLGEASVEEWFATLQGGQDVWAVRHEMIYPDAAEKGPAVGWVSPEDIMRWTGKAKRNENEPKYKLWYEVSLLKSGRMMKGWFKGNIVDAYIFPTEGNDPANEANLEEQFDLSKSLLRHPADKEIEDAVAELRGAHQYIDVAEVLGARRIHNNLCGEFCVAALAGVDVIPFLKDWLAGYSNSDKKNFLPDPVKVLKNNLGTGLSEVQFMLDVCGITHSEYRYTPSISPVTPLRLKRDLDEGKLVYWGVAIFKLGGKLSGKSTSNTTRHWIVLEDVIAVGNSGWVRIYNPFNNREEIYNYNYFMDSVGQFGLGLLVEGWKRNKM